MRTLTLDGGITMTDYTMEGKFMEVFGLIITESLLLRKVWKEEMRQEGIVLIHPNDGWVDQLKNKVAFAYPDILKAGDIDVGALACLGTHEDYRIVKLIERHICMFSVAMNGSPWENCSYSFRTISRTIDRRSKRSAGAPVATV